LKDECRVWLQYAEENLASAEVLLQSQLLNPCLQNSQQAIEKALKAVIVGAGLHVPRTRSIRELMRLVRSHETSIEMDEDELDLVDSIYLPSKYPLGSALPDFAPTDAVAQRCVSISKRVVAAASDLVSL